VVQQHGGNQVQRYHVRIGQRRTTVSMDNIVSEYLSLRLRVAPHDPKSHGTVRAWLQEKLNRISDPNQNQVSQWLLGQALRAMVTEDLRHRYDSWRTRQRSRRPRKFPGMKRRRVAAKRPSRAREAVDAVSS
jgi:hypothetical protein